MSTDLVAYDDRHTFDLLPKAHELAQAIAKTEFVPKGLRNRPEAVLACVLAGHEMGIGPMQALAKIDVIEGKPAPSAELMRALILRAGHEVWIEESTVTRVTLCGRRAGSDHTTKVTWTIDDARRAKLAGKQVWQSYPRAMLLARATGELARSIFPDVIAGLSYTTEEVADGVHEGWVFEGDDAAEVAEQRAAEPSKATRTRKAATTGARKATAARARAEVAAGGRPAAPPLPGEEPIETTAADGLPAEPEFHDDNEPDGIVDELATKRAQAIAMKARDLDLDHHHVVAAVCPGHTSAKTLTQDQAEAVLEALRQLKTGDKALDQRDGDWILVDVDEAELVEPAGEPDLAEVQAWDAETWKEHLRAKGVKVTATIKEAQRLAGETGVDPPGSLADLQGTDLAALVAAWVEEEGF